MPVHTHGLPLVCWSRLLIVCYCYSCWCGHPDPPAWCTDPPAGL